MIKLQPYENSYEQNGWTQFKTSKYYRNICNHTEIIRFQLNLRFNRKRKSKKSFSQFFHTIKWWNECKFEQKNVRMEDFFFSRIIQSDILIKLLLHELLNAIWRTWAVSLFFFIQSKKFKRLFNSVFVISKNFYN